MAPSVPAPWQGRDTFPKGEGSLIRVPNVIRGKISTPSLLGKVAFALQEAKDGRVWRQRLLLPASLLFARMPPSGPALKGGRATFPKGEGFLIRVPNMIGGKNFAPLI